MIGIRGMSLVLLGAVGLMAAESQAQLAYDVVSLAHVPCYDIFGMSPNENAGTGEPATLAPRLHITSFANCWYNYSIMEYDTGAVVDSGSIWGGRGNEITVWLGETAVRVRIRPMDPAASGLSWCQTYQWTVTSRYSSVEWSARFTPIPPETWTLESLLISGRYADPCAVKLTDGSGYRLYFTDDTARTLVSAYSADGITWTMESGTRFGACTWPEVVALGGDRYRLYYGQPDSSGRNMAFYSALSTDGGLTFTAESGTRLSAGSTVYDTDGIQGPSVLKLSDGTFRMYYQGLANAYWDGVDYLHDTYLLSATSTDGLTWTFESMVVDGTVAPFDDPLIQEGVTTPAAIVMSDGSTRLYFKANSDTTTGDPGVHKAVSRDGLNFHVCTTPEFAVSDMTAAWGDQFGDPSLLELPDGTYRMFMSSWDLGIATARGTISP